MSEKPSPEIITNRADRGKKRSRLIALAAAALVAVVGIGGPAVVLTTSGDAPTTIEHRLDPAESVARLGDATLNELVTEPTEPGPALETTPTDGRAPTVEEGTSQGEESVGGIDDPFAGMTEAEIDALSDEAFGAILEQAGWTIDGASVGSEGGGGSAGGDSETPIGEFPVDGDRIDVSGASPEVVREAQAIWKRFVELIPADQRQMVVGFELLPEEASGAYVYPTDQDPKKWVLGVGMGLGGELDSVLIHEFGHLLTLQAKEVPPSGNPSGCTTYFTGEGCALSGSTFARFVHEFWPQDMIEQTRRIQERGDWDAADAFYREHQDEFVTDYATTNPAEDLAETFTAFVMNDRPGGDTVADQKVGFFWDDPAMTALREQIRTGLEVATLVAA